MMQRSKELVLTMTCLAAFALLGACSSPLGSLPPVSAASASEYRLQPGDELLVTIQDVAQADRSYIIDSGGTISLPLLQEVKVAGLSVREVENRIAEGFRARELLKNPIISVQPGALRPFYVIGEVNSPGEINYRQGMTVLSAISAAGGYTYRAQEGQVEVVRTVNGQEVRSKASEDTLIQPGDRIRVYERWF
ncbi:polysaccharide export protein [Qipengyuania citrea]|jgi:protein involved in polysaccharide export with SLBB domain|uniref:Polysaccharide export protein n=1 Tax=Qipengyuania citrea TaxID=225971 RepID=A0ABY4U5A4_9SPHN|nr:polysaccharide biosynthesis/export family protein [Qipengyuania citrea]MCH2495529.1 polysaccharide export protein [Erythrobacter sp.]MEE2793942.1 polysaccharide biosynthesis/export family protein [Pseudomonadota bacterium]QPL38455.1 polysaccharide export protein [Erythrobacter sp. A30-3]USA60011.1 polysaccharide export protein [Qipengyuania citrea]|tara:strand:+ start:367 stop:945 length:579 start_codon:yes stop_codon:yes gene_type:complete